MTHFRMTVSSFGHPYEPLGLGHIQPRSSWSMQVINPDSVAPRQQDITILENGDRDTKDMKDIGMHSSEFHTDESSAMDPTFLFSTMCFQPMALAFRSCNVFRNMIYDLFGHANGNRAEYTTPSKEIIYGQPSLSRNAVSTVDFTDGLSPTEICCNKEEQTSHSALSTQKIIIVMRYVKFWKNMRQRC